jgi:hypothetical protein
MGSGGHTNVQTVIQDRASDGRQVVVHGHVELAHQQFIPGPFSGTQQCGRYPCPLRGFEIAPIVSDNERFGCADA